MTLVRDPSFWRRFSIALQQDEEAQKEALSASSSTSVSTTGKRPQIKHTQSWLARQEKKQSRRTLLCWLFWVVFFLLVGGIVFGILWLHKAGILGGSKPNQ